MTLHPIFASLRKHKSGVVLIALQIAFTLAIVCNAIFIISQRIQKIGRETGMVENNLFLVSQQWVGAPSADDEKGVEVLDSMQREDLAALRNMPDVASVTPTNSLPLFTSSWTGSVGLQPGKGNYDTSGNGTARVSYYFVDDQALGVLGVKMVAGHFFRSGDVINISSRDERRPNVMVITKMLAEKMFPGENAVGKTLYLDGGAAPVRVIGIIDTLQAPEWVKSFQWNSVLIPARLDSGFSRYAIRAKPGREAAAMKAVAGVLYGVNPMRVLDENSVKSFSDIRNNAYQSDLGMAIVMGVVCIILLGVTTAGIVGLTSFWVGQRRKQIGVRRALGARKIDILFYFQLENLAISCGGVIIGIVLAIGLNFLLMSHFEMDRLPVSWVLLGVVVVLLLGQAAVFVPARRASNVSPVMATRMA